MLGRQGSRFLQGQWEFHYDTYRLCKGYSLVLQERAWAFSLEEKLECGHFCPPKLQRKKHAANVWNLRSRWLDIGHNLVLDVCWLSRSRNTWTIKKLHEGQYLSVFTSHLVNKGFITGSTALQLSAGYSGQCRSNHRAGSGSFCSPGEKNSWICHPSNLWRAALFYVIGSMSQNSLKVWSTTVGYGEYFEWIIMYVLCYILFLRIRGYSPKEIGIH